ncbi:hypothetical protein ASD86_09045 [Lysobacter sp. Root690]|nr:hypothetical protein ASD86_09045 [Lysobacter sp. Root690]
MHRECGLSDLLASDNSISLQHSMVLSAASSALISEHVDSRDRMVVLVSLTSWQTLNSTVCRLN